MVAPSLPPAEDLQLILKLILTPSLRYLSTTTSQLYRPKHYRTLLWWRERSWTFSVEGGRRVSHIPSLPVFGCKVEIPSESMWNNFNRESFYRIKTFSLDLAEILLIKWEYHQPCSGQISPLEILSSDQWTNPDADDKKSLWFISHMCALWRLYTTVRII